MKAVSLILALCALCAVAFADEFPSVLNPCAFRTTWHMIIKSVDGEELATSMNEIVRLDNYWLWKSMLQGSQFISSIVPDHQWSIIWRPDMGVSYRYDVMTRRCSNATDLPPPFEWMEKMTQGIVWFDEPVMYGDKEATLFTAASSGTYHDTVTYEAIAGFYVINEDKSLVRINGTINVNHGEIDAVFDTTSIFFEHNKPVDPKLFVVEPPCKEVAAPPAPSADWQAKCYSGASMASVSMLALVIAFLVTFLSL